MTTEKTNILRIILPVPLRRHFDYLQPKGCDTSLLQPGVRVRVPFQNRELVGIFKEFTSQSDAPLSKLKPILEILDTAPVISADILHLCQWAADYYHFPLGEVLANAMPGLLRQGKSVTYVSEIYYQLTDAGRAVDFENLKRAKKQIDALKIFLQFPQGLSVKQLKFYKITTSLIKILLEKNYIVATSQAITHPIKKEEHPLALNAAQQQALDAILAVNSFQVFLLNGVTGSGKTEVYLQAIANVLNQNKQVLVLVPEIGLTPQTLQRFRERFSVSVVALHSGLSEKERLNAWISAKENDAKIIIGTRSAIFTPFANLGLIIVDEEHDLSFKQQEGFRYHARDLAIMRAHFNNVPIVLGSATPALETLHKAQRGRYQHLLLPERAGSAQLPQFRIVDIRKIPLEQGLSFPLLDEMKKHINAGNQVMLFLNRRGYAPVLMCHACGWLALCKRCDARMTFHQSPAHLHCHHCDSRKHIPIHCEVCREKSLTTLGLGTERLEILLQKYFPDTTIARIDRDSTQRKGKMEELLNDIQQNKYQILIGTQMLAKGHHFPNVTLVAIVDADSGFFSSDFRALERMGQLVLQVSGRAGRDEKPGTVMIQTHHPEHPLLHQLLHENYPQFANTLLLEREQALLPPFSFFALFRAEAHLAEHANDFLLAIKNLSSLSSAEMQLLGPISAPMPKRAERHRVQLLLQTTQRPLLQNFLKMIIPEIEKIPGKQRVKWSLDVDPMEMF